MAQDTKQQLWYKNANSLNDDETTSELRSLGSFKELFSQGSNIGLPLGYVVKDAHMSLIQGIGSSGGEHVNRSLIVLAGSAGTRGSCTRKEQM